MRGEHTHDARILQPRGGSAPHARGTQGFAEIVPEDGRFSPACAGNTTRRSRGRAAPPVQPRMRGEHGWVWAGGSPRSGSAPHARGTRVVAAAVLAAIRFSPACAGNTAASAFDPSACPVQPRMRGEHDLGPQPAPGTPGSAPHARGTHNGRCRAPQRRRFSPACAGNTAGCWPGCLAPAVQPRMRGEHSWQEDWCCVRNGSAPHARGTHRTRANLERCARFSPACAGNTPC